MDPRERINNREEAFRAMLDMRQAEIHTAFPGVVISFNAEALTAVIQPAIKAKIRPPTGIWEDIAYPNMLDCPVQFPSGGGFTLTFPLSKGDEVLVILAERCIDAWWSLGGADGSGNATPQVQAEFRMHDLSDGFCIPKVWSQPKKIADVSTDSAQLRSDDGTTVITVAEGSISMSPDSGTTSIVLTPGKIVLTAAEIVTHATTKNVWDADGTGFVYTAGQIDTYTQDVPSTSHAPTPPEVPT